MKRLFAIALVVFAGFVFGLSETRTISSDASTLEQLVEVRADFSLERLLPGIEYAGSIAVDYAVPGESMRNINVPKVIVHVRADGIRGDTWIYFRGFDGKSAQATRSVEFGLACIVRNDGCDPQGSVLSAVVPVFYMAPNGAVGGSDGVTVVAQLEEFEEEIELVELPQATAVAQGAAGNSGGGATSGWQQELGGAFGGIASLAGELVDGAKAALGGIQTQGEEPETAGGGSDDADQLAVGAGGRQVFSGQEIGGSQAAIASQSSDPLTGLVTAATRNWFTSALILAGLVAAVLVVTKKRREDEPSSGQYGE